MAHPRTLPRDHYEAVAAVWLEEAAKRGGKPNVAVAAKWDVPHSTATAWIKRARQLGILTQRLRRAHTCPGCGHQIPCERGGPLKAEAS